MSQNGFIAKGPIANEFLSLTFRPSHDCDCQSSELFFKRLSWNIKAVATSQTKRCVASLAFSVPFSSIRDPPGKWCRSMMKTGSRQAEQPTAPTMDGDYSGFENSVSQFHGQRPWLPSWSTGMELRSTKRGQGTASSWGRTGDCGL